MRLEIKLSAKQGKLAKDRPVRLAEAIHSTLVDSAELVRKHIANSINRHFSSKEAEYDYYPRTMRGYGKGELANSFYPLFGKTTNGQFTKLRSDKPYAPVHEYGLTAPTRQVFWAHKKGEDKPRWHFRRRGNVHDYPETAFARKSLHEKREEIKLILLKRIKETLNGR